MRKTQIFAGLALLLCLLSGAAAAQSAQVYLAPGTDMAKNVPYVKDNRTYARDGFSVDIPDSCRMTYKTTKDVVTYLYSVSVPKDQEITLFLSIGSDEPLTTAYLNGKALSEDTPVTVDLTRTSDLNVATKSARALVRLSFSNLPLIDLSFDGKLTKNDTDAVFTIFDPQHADRGTETYDAVISLRGQSSSRFPEKRPYNVSLMKDGAKYDVPLLSMRKDSDWILDSAFNDASRMRNRVCMDVWKDMCHLPWNENKSGATTGEFVEVFVNGKYKGLFALSEKQDRKQLGLQKPGGDVSGLIVRSTVTFSEDHYSPAGFHSLGRKKPGADDITLWYNQEIRFPKAEYLTQDSWKEMYDFTALVIKGTDRELADRIENYVNLENIADYYLFNNALNLSDNMRKNMTYVQYDKGTPFMLVPWDLDSSLGRVYSSKKSGIKDTSANKLFTRLLNGNILNFREIVVSRWNVLKDTALSLDNIMGHFSYYHEIISRAGAVGRETETHPSFKTYLEAGYHFNLDIDQEMVYIRNYMEKHLAYWAGQVQKLAR